MFVVEDLFLEEVLLLQTGHMSRTSQIGLIITYWMLKTPMTPRDGHPIRTLSHRTSSYPQPPPPQRQRSISTEHVHILKSPFTSYRPHATPSVPFSPSRFAGEDIVQFGPPGIPMNHWPSQAGLPPGPHHSNGLTHHRLHRMQPSHNFSNLQSQLHASHPPMNGMADSREQRMRPLQSGRQNTWLPQQGSDDSGWPQFRSKYMSADEIDSILRIQHASTHSNDPYVDDYYHQACLAKKFSGSNSRPRRHFCPTYIRDLPSHTKASSEPHAYLQVDALGRIPFSSIRRPRPQSRSMFDVYLKWRYQWSAVWVLVV